MKEGKRKKVKGKSKNSACDLLIHAARRVHTFAFCPLPFYL